MNQATASQNKLPLGGAAKRAAMTGGHGRGQASGVRRADVVMLGVQSFHL